jgi:ubiquinone/menaquinone biosynthesis C-methylase UbiE
MSIVFDRAVDYYDQTRALPPAVQAAAMDTLAREANLSTTSRVLEMGIGTGRVAIPLAEKIGHMTGIDLSLAMMGVLQHKLEGTALRVDLAQANAVRLPFADARFDAVIAVHVLHLVEGWERALSEALRVLQPGGVFVSTFHRRDSDSPNVLLRKKLHALAEEHGINTQRPGAKSEEEVLEALRNFDQNARVVAAAEWDVAEVPAQILAELDRQIFSETWMLPRVVLDQVMPQLRGWAEEKFGALERGVQIHHTFRWLVARKRA